LSNFRVSKHLFVEKNILGRLADFKVKWPDAYAAGALILQEGDQ